LHGQDMPSARHDFKLLCKSQARSRLALCQFLEANGRKRRRVLAIATKMLNQNRNKVAMSALRELSPPLRASLSFFFSLARPFGLIEGGTQAVICQNEHFFTCSCDTFQSNT